MISIGVTHSGQRLGLTILENADDTFEGVTVSETRVTDILQTGLDESLLISQPVDGLREVSNEPSHGKANNAGKSTLCNVQASTAQWSPEEGSYQTGKSIARHSSWEALTKEAKAKKKV